MKNYQDYLQSNEWRRVKKEKIAEQGFCYRCGSVKHLQVHHLTYRRVGGDERPADLIVLCAKCHRHTHQNKSNPLKLKRLRDN